ncbi:RidA family protein [Pleurocapsa sp. FMAR1]|uniref:RidA family protein n=1 Tax=Pleurocapsa sp. FMAR1 TaxID=3040204 RepID=UPI0029C79D79|nr:RidA family protein [Pleurocapsa sp. FMAR1]
MFRFWQKAALIFILVIGLFIGSLKVTSAQVIRNPIPDSDFPIAQSVEVPPETTLIYVSGQVPSVVDESAKPDSIAAYGNTKTQTVNVLKEIQSILESLNLTMGDVVKMQAFIVGDPDNEGQMDFGGFMEGYTQFFGTKTQPNLPARSAMQVAGLVNPGWLVEIEVVAVKS